ncbi:hypothetical protein EJ07DRAFT_165529 [Lizonia empirigonia]|nr:hypothetical protein EJ07DRAFT_165529 [Lizonia empirigonia]
MRYIRFLKPPRIATDKRTHKPVVACLITLTSDLGDSFFPHHVELAAELVAPGTTPLAICLSLKKSYAAGPLRVRIGVEPQAAHDSLDDLSQPDSHGIVSAWSADFSAGSPEAARRVERRFCFGGKMVCIWEETGDSIARHLWDAGITLAHHLSTPRLQTALLPAPRPASLCVLELGTGCGIVGLTLAALIPGASVTLTDLPDAQDIVSHNLSHTHALLAPASRAAFAELDWAAPLPAVPAPHLVLAADCTYNPDSSPALVDTLRALAATSPHLVVAVALKLRHESERVFFDLMAHAGFRETTTLQYALPGDLAPGEEEVEVHVYRHRG